MFYSIKVVRRIRISTGMPTVQLSSLASGLDLFTYRLVGPFLYSVSFGNKGSTIKP